MISMNKIVKVIDLMKETSVNSIMQYLSDYFNHLLPEDEGDFQKLLESFSSSRSVIDSDILSSFVNEKDLDMPYEEVLSFLAELPASYILYDALYEEGDENLSYLPISELPNMELSGAADNALRSVEFSLLGSQL